MSSPVDLLADLARRLERLEAESEVRRIAADYFDLCDRLDQDAVLDALAALFEPDAVWAGKGARYAETLGVHFGRESIMAMLGRYRGPPAHFALNAHFLTRDHIVVAGNEALGRWLMLQTSAYAAGGSDLRAARIEIAFHHTEGRWRIRRLETENLFSRPVDRWDDLAPIPLPHS